LAESILDGREGCVICFAKRLRKRLATIHATALPDSLPSWLHAAAHRRIRGCRPNYVVEAAEFRDGAFRPAAEIPAQVENGMPRFRIDSVQSKLLLLISRRATIGEARGLMTEALR
jgi:hypothetical protein